MGYWSGPSRLHQISVYTNMKNLFAVLVVMAAMAVNSFAQLGNPNVLITSGTADSGETYKAITNNTANLFTNAIVDVSRRSSVVFAFTGALTGAGTTANTITVQQSVDRRSWSTLLAFTVTPAGTTPVTVVTNVNIGAIPYVRVSSIANASANTGFITNFTVRVFTK